MSYHLLHTQSQNLTGVWGHGTLPLPAEAGFTPRRPPGTPCGSLPPACTRAETCSPPSSARTANPGDAQPASSVVMIRTEIQSRHQARQWVWSCSPAHTWALSGDCSSLGEEGSPPEAASLFAGHQGAALLALPIAGITQPSTTYCAGRRSRQVRASSQPLERAGRRPVCLAHI